MLKNTSIILGLILMQSCLGREKYFRFSDEERSLLVYEEGEIFKLRSQDGDTFRFYVQDKSIGFEQVRIHFSSRKHFGETASIEFISTDDIGRIVAQGGIDLQKRTDHEFLFALHLKVYEDYPTIMSDDFSVGDPYEFHSNLTVDGSSYTNVYYFKNPISANSYRELFIASSEGILHVGNTDTGHFYKRVE